MAQLFLLKKEYREKFLRSKRHNEELKIYDNQEKYKKKNIFLQYLDIFSKPFISLQIKLIVP